MKLAAFSMAHNTTLLTGAAIAQKIISALFFFLVSWFIGTEQTAVYFNVFAAIAVFTVVADFGLNNVLTREAARDEVRAPRVFFQALLLKCIFGCVALGALAVSRGILTYPNGSWGTIVLAGITLWFDSLRGLLYGYLRSYKNVRYEAIGVVGAQAFTTIVGTVFLLLHAPLMLLIGVFMVSSILQTAYAAWCVVFRALTPLRMIYDRELAMLMVREALPFAAAGIMAQLYAYQDAFIINHYLTPAAGGDWARAYKFVYAFQFIPISLGASIYPAISAAYEHERQKIVSIIVYSYEYVLLLVLPLMTGIALVTGPLFGRYFHKFVPSLPILHLLVWSLGGGFLWYVNGAVLNGSRRQHIQTFCIASAFVTSVLINIYAVPRFGARGAAVAAVVSNTLLWVLSYCWITKFLTLPHTMLARRCARIVGATLGMVLCVSGARLAGFHPLALVASGVLAYGVGIWLFGAFSSEVRNMLCDKTSKLLVLCRITQRL